MTPGVKERIEQVRHGNVPDGYKKVKTGIIPNNWKYEVLAPYLVQHHEMSEYSDQYPVLTSSRKGIFLQSDYYNKEIASEDNTGYNVVPRGYFTYRHMSDDEIFRFNINTIVDKGIVSTLYPVFTTSAEINDIFLREILNGGSDFHRYAILQKQGGSRTYMYFEKLRKLVLPIPPLEEQTKIAEILTVQDKVVELKEKLLAEKQQQKKHLMQQLLTGKKRLSGFDDGWQNCRLRQIAQRIRRKNTIGNENVLTISAQYGLINQSEFFNKEIASEDKSDYYLLNRNDFAYNKSYSSGYPYGAIKRLTRYDEGIVSPLYICFEITGETVSLEYMEQYFEAGLMNREIQAFAQEGARNHGLLNIAVDDFFNSKIVLPSLEEQQAIAVILMAADKEIKLLQQDLEQEKQMKKALMQLLLTGIVHVAV